MSSSNPLVRMAPQSYLTLISNRPHAHLDHSSAVRGHLSLQPIFTFVPRVRNADSQLVSCSIGEPNGGNGGGVFGILF